MAEPIRLSASGISSYDAKKAASAVDQAVNYLQQVKLDIDFKDSFSGMSMFPNTQGELRSVLSTLEKKKETIDALVTALSNGTQTFFDGKLTPSYEAGSQVAELWADFFAAQMTHDEAALSLIKQHFPTAYAAMEQMALEMV